MTKAEQTVAEAILRALANSGKNGQVDFDIYWRCREMAANLFSKRRKPMWVARSTLNGMVCGAPAFLEKIGYETRVPLCEKHQP